MPKITKKEIERWNDYADETADSEEPPTSPYSGRKYDYNDDEAFEPHDDDKFSEIEV